MSGIGKVACVWPVAATLGEGPVWDARSQMLWFVDIRQAMLHRFDPAAANPGDGTRTSFAVGRNPSFALPAYPRGLVVGDRDRLLHWDGGTETALATIAMPAHNRVNDATVDPRGRIWFGTMDDEEYRSTGAIHVYDRGTIAIAGGDAVVTNGPAITADGRWLYHVDSSRGVIWRVDLARGERLDHGEVFARLAPGEGAPDGVTIDARDHLWVGLWGGWGLRRYAPDGVVADEVRLPCAQVTKLAFGGPGLATAFVTTARVGLSVDALSAQPLAGGLFAFTPPAPGVPLPLAMLPDDFPGAFNAAR